MEIFNYLKKVLFSTEKRGNPGGISAIFLLPANDSMSKL